MDNALYSVASPIQKTGITPLSVGSVMGDLHIVQILVQAMTFKLSRSGKPCKKVSNWVICPFIWRWTMPTCMTAASVLNLHVWLFSCRVDYLLCMQQPLLVTNMSSIFFWSVNSTKTLTMKACWNFLIQTFEVRWELSASVVQDEGGTSVIHLVLHARYLLF